jgi:uncharacterized protein YbjT (DUF2867 family)
LITLCCTAPPRAISVVGTERLLASGYFRAKMAQEYLIQAAKIPPTRFDDWLGRFA